MVTRPHPQINIFNKDIPEVAHKVLEIDKWQQLMKILQNLMETTRNHHLQPLLTREVNALKIILRQAWKEGNLNFVLLVVHILERQIQVCCTWFLVAFA